MASKRADITRVRVKVIPRSSRDEIAGNDHGILRVKLTAPPVEGRANRSLIAFFAQNLGVPKRDLEIVSGKRSRIKSLAIYGLSEADICNRLQLESLETA